MKKVSIKKISLVGLTLMSASAIIAAVMPGKANARFVNNGTLRQFSATAAGADQDAAQAILSCIPEDEAVQSCTATAITLSTTADTTHDANDRQTQGNTSNTAAVAGDQNSVLVVG